MGQTLSGKQKSRLNAVKHGFTAKQITVLPIVETPPAPAPPEPSPPKIENEPIAEVASGKVFRNFTPLTPKDDDFEEMLRELPKHQVKRSGSGKGKVPPSKRRR